jgi:hypothetical protein
MKFNAPGLFVTTAADSATVVVRALLFYEGEHTDSSGRKSRYSIDRINKMATATNQLIDGGRRLKFFADHQYRQENVFGAIEGQVSVETITTPPHSGMDALIGKLGIFANVRISGEDNVAAYQDGRIKELSVGIDVKGEMFGIKDAIYELSAVGIPALAGAALFGLTIGDAAMELENQRDLYQEWDLFTSVLYAIDRATDSEIEESGKSRPALRNQAVKDFAARLEVRFPVDATNVPLYKHEMKYTEEELRLLEEKANRADALQVELDSVKRSTQASARFSKLKDNAQVLVSKGQLTPAQFKLFGFEDEATVAKFSADGGDREMDKIEIQLDTIAKFAAPMKFGSYLEDEPLNTGGSAPPEVEAANMDRLKVTPRI